MKASTLSKQVLLHVLRTNLQAYDVKPAKNQLFIYLLSALHLFKTDIFSWYEKGKSIAKYRIGRTHFLVYL